MKLSSPVIKAVKSLPQYLRNDMEKLANELFAILDFRPLLGTPPLGAPAFGEPTLGEPPGGVTFLGLCEGDFIEDAENATRGAPVPQPGQLAGLTALDRDESVGLVTAWAVDNDLLHAGVRRMFVTFQKMLAKLLGSPPHPSVAAVKAEVDKLLGKPAPTPWSPPAPSGGGKVSVFPERPVILVNRRQDWSDQLAAWIATLADPQERPKDLYTVRKKRYTDVGIVIGWFDPSTKTLECGAYNEDKMHVLGSTGKLFALHATRQLYAAAQRFVEANKPSEKDTLEKMAKAFNDEIGDAVRTLPVLSSHWKGRRPAYAKMFVPLAPGSDGELLHLTAGCEDDLRIMVKVGGNKGNTAAANTIGKLGHYAYVNALHERLGLFDSVTKERLWLGTDFSQTFITDSSGERVQVNTQKIMTETREMGGSVASAMGLARLMTYLLAKSADGVGPEHRTLTYIGYTDYRTRWLPPNLRINEHGGNENTLRSWLLDLANEPPGAYQIVYQKRGYTSASQGDTMSEVSVWKDPSGKMALLVFEHLIVEPGEGDKRPALWVTRRVQLTPLANMIATIIGTGSFKKP